MHSFFTLLTLLPALVAAHGYLCTPPPRGFEKESYQIDALKSPNFSKQTCRGEGPGQITNVQPGGSITLDFKITAPHVGPCEVYLLDLDLDLSKQVKIAEKRDCAAPGKVAPWTVQIPDGITGRKVLRWYWEGQHIGTPGEPYEQCVDLQIGSGGGSDLYAGNSASNDKKPVPPPRRMPPVPAPASDAESEEQAPEPTYGQEKSYGEAEPERVTAQSHHDDEEQSYGSEEEEEEEPSDYDNEDDCEHGQYVCNQDGGFSICNLNSWVRQSCGAGQVCVPSNGSILCVSASQAENY